MTTKLGIIGFPIKHSISPVFQQAALDHLHIDATYQAWEVAPGDVAAFVQRLRSPEMLGINVTVPHKEAVIPYLDESDASATAAGAVNTIVNRGGRLSGHNTDGSGFLRALRDTGGFDPRGRRVLLLGAGGAARGVSLALILEGIGHLTIANRTLSRADVLVKLAGIHGVNAQAIPLDGTALAAAAASADLIVNCTTIGMSHGPDETGTLLSQEQIPSTALVNDLVYNPLETPLHREAAKAGARILGGFHMLVYQGAASFEMWTGQDAPVAVMLKAATRAMRERA
ncbi:MAG: shikimate dehydrogenase [Dehalococcoidia bacterium]|nr:shikimate dehydrogenase [Dehalococcoidia bacterium]